MIGAGGLGPRNWGSDLTKILAVIELRGCILGPCISEFQNGIPGQS
jgi:hypothetical protein